MELFRARTYPEVSSPQELQSLFAQNKLYGFHNVREEVYHAGPGLSSSILKAYRESPAHARDAMDGKVFSSDAMQFGSACHAAIFEPGRFDSTYLVGPECDRRTKAGKQLWADAVEYNPGSILLKPRDAQDLMGMRDSITAHPDFAPIASRSGYPEISYYWSQLGWFCKARFDWITTTALPLHDGEKRTIFDLKTTRFGVSEGEVRKTIEKFGYDVQASWYLSAMPDANFVFIFASKIPPYEVAFFPVTPEMRAQGHEKIDTLLQRHAECSASGIWPADSGSEEPGE